MNILDDRFDSSEVYPMKKIVRWALALAAVMAVPSSAMALVGTDIYHSSVVSGSYRFGTGHLRFTYDQGVDGLYDSACAYFVRWTNEVPYLSSAASAYVEEPIQPGYDDCEDNAYHGIPSVLRLSTVLYPDSSYGYDKFQIKRKLFRMMMGEDMQGNFAGMCQYHPAAMPYGMVMEHSATP
jgi:hypothetical protein